LSGHCREEPDEALFVGSRAASAFKSCFFKTPSIKSGSLFGVRPKQETPPSESFWPPPIEGRNAAVGQNQQANNTHGFFI
jgi:hypothetical protein